VQHKVDDACRVTEFRFAQDRVCKGEGDRAQRTGCCPRVESQAVEVRLEQRSDGGVELLGVRLLAPAEIVMIFGGSAVQLKSVEEREHSAEATLQHDHCLHHASFQIERLVNGRELVACPGDVKGLIEHGVDQGLLGGEDAKDRAFGDSGRIGDLTRAHLTAELLEQRLSRRYQRGPPLVAWQWGGSGHQSILMSEHSLNKRIPAISVIDFRYGRAVGLGRLTERVFDAVLFDMDGTLIDSTPAVIRAWNMWAVEHGLPADVQNGWHGVPSASVVRAVLEADRHEAAIARINELEIAELDDIVILPGATEALAALRGAKNAIATSCTVPLAQARLAAAQLTPPSVLVTADDVLHGKPSPDPYLEAARRLGVDPARCLVVEDAPAGLKSARAAGCATLAVITTTRPEDLIADAVVKDLSHVQFEVTPLGIRVKAASATPGTRTSTQAPARDSAAAE
jgi:mannitol-1-/sugar-/sorbitol-6-phosphatase